MNALSPNALQILKSRYLLRDTGHKIIESPDQLFERVAKAVAKAESKWGDLKTVVHWGERFLEIMSNLEFLPNSPTLMNAGTTKGQLSACFVLPIDDNLFSIFTTLRDTALIHQSGGGTGFNFSNLRPHGDIVSSSSGVSSGPISFIRIFDVATEEIKQGGKRRGANMGILDINHPDIEDFIQCKSDGKSLRNFNLSIGLSDAFMHCLKNNGQWQLINPRTGKITRSLKAKFLWRKIAEEAWKTGDPGLIFTDNINAHNPTPTIADIEATNPCGEMPLLNYESCNLGSINLSRMITNGASGPEPDWDKIASTVHTGIRFLDDVVEVNHYPLEMIAKMTRANRKIGLGVMGWAEMLIALEIPYASDEAVQLGGQIMQFVQEQSNQSSKALAKERGAFPNWEKSIYNKGEPYRNATRTAIAPTGTISIIAGTSSSIEPLYGLYHRRRKILSNKSLFEVNHLFVEKIKQKGYWSEQIEQHVCENGTLEKISGIPKKIKALFNTALEIPWEYHILHQHAFQKFTDSAVSKTINLPKDTTVDAIERVFFTAWESGLKGITIYRSESRTDQVLQLGDGKKITTSRAKKCL